MNQGLLLISWKLRIYHWRRLKVECGQQPRVYGQIFACFFGFFLNDYSYPVSAKNPPMPLEHVVDSKQLCFCVCFVFSSPLWLHFLSVFGLFLPAFFPVGERSNCELSFKCRTEAELLLFVWFCSVRLLFFL